VRCELLSKVPDNIWSFITQTGTDILLKALANSTPLEEIAEVYGASTVAEGSEYPTLLIDKGAVNHSKKYARFVVSGSITRYATSWETGPVQFTHRKYMRPLIKLEPPMPSRRVEQARSPKIIICKVALDPRAFLDTGGQYAGAYTTYVLESGLSLAFITGIINSRLMSFLYRTLYDALAMGGGYLRFQPPQIRRLPIRTINFSDPADKARHYRMVALVEQMLELHKRLHAAKKQTDRELYQRQIDSTDKQIDALIYELYGLTEDEIKIVESGG
jgi:TaqI-like C-terminal specificity domain